MLHDLTLQSTDLGSYQPASVDADYYASVWLVARGYR
jgi:hypothetical protein